MTVRLVPTPPPRPPRLELLEPCWRFRGPTRRVVSCGIYTTDVGLEVRAGYSAEDLLRSERAHDLGAARQVAETWRQAVIAKGGFEPLPIAP